MDIRAGMGRASLHYSGDVMLVHQTVLMEAMKMDVMVRYSYIALK